jgi:hypothetical protein
MPMFSSSSFKDSGLWSILIFVQNEDVVLVFYMWYWVSQHLLKRLSLFHCMFWVHLSKNHMAVQSYFWIFYSIGSSIVLCFRPTPCCFCYYGLLNNLKLGITPPTLVFLFDYLGSYGFSNWFSCSVKNVIGI